ncbi:MAG: rhodanese-like domain-containing protein [Bacteroidia bacterium]
MQTITVTELKARIDNGEKPIIIDVREPYEFEDFNINGRLIPLGNIQAAVPDLEEIADEEIIIHCHAGSRSAAAADFLTKQGFSNVKNLTGGMVAWKAMVGV